MTLLLVIGIVFHSFLKIQLPFKMLVKIFSWCKPHQFPSQVPQMWNVDWAALSVGFTPGARAFQRAVNSPVALLGRGFSCQLLHDSFPRWWGHLRIMTVVSFPPAFVGGGGCAGWWGEGWWMRGGAVSSCLFSLRSVRVVSFMRISRVWVHQLCT